MLEGLEFWEKVLTVVGSFLGSLLSLGALIGGFHRWVIRPQILTPIKKCNELIQANTDMTGEMKKQVEFCVSELKTNGGKSIKDTVNKMSLSMLDFERKQLISELNNAKASGLYKSILSSIHVGHWESDAKGRFVTAGVSMCRIMKRNESEILGFNWLSWVHEDDRVAIRTEWMDALNTGRDFDMEFRCIHPQGEIQRVRIVAFQVFSHDGSDSRFAGFIGTLSAVGKSYKEGSEPAT